MSKLSSWLKKRGGKVGELANKVGSVLPSTGQLIGGAALGPIGQVVGGRVDPHTSDLQQGIGDTVATAAAGMGAGKVLGGFGKAAVDGAIPNADDPNAHSGDDGSDTSPDPASAIPNAPSGGGKSWAETLAGFGGDVVKAATAFAAEHGQSALEAYNIYNSAQRQGQADKYAQGALKGTEDRFAAKQGLRDSGIAGMMHPAAPDLSKLKSIAGAQSGNPFAGAVPPRLPIPNASAPAPRAPQVTLPNPMAGAALPIAAPQTLAPGLNPATGQRPQPPYDPRKLPLPIATRLGG